MIVIKKYHFIFYSFILAVIFLAIQPAQAEIDWNSCPSIIECGMNVVAVSNSSQSIFSSSIPASLNLTCPDGTVFSLSTPPSLSDAKAKCDAYRTPSSGADNPPATGNSDCIITGDNINIRSGPGTAYGIIATLASDEEFIATGQNNGWWYGIFNGESAWISADVTTATGDSCANLEEVEAPPPPTIPSGGGTNPNDSQVDTVSCLNFAHLRPSASEIAQTEVDFAWTEATGAGFYELVIYDFANNVAATFSTEATTITINLGLVATGASMSWEVRAYDASGAYACVTTNSGQIPMQGDPNPAPPPQPAETEEPVNCELDPYNSQCI